MVSREFIYFVIWVFLSVALAFFLFAKIKFFKKPAGFLILFLTALLSVLLHNLIYALFDFEEALFFIITFLSLGTGISLFWIWLIGILRKKAAIILAIGVLTVIFGLFLFLPKTETEEKETSIDSGGKLCNDLCGDGVCQETVCMATGCPCAETSKSCPEDCKE